MAKTKQVTDAFIRADQDTKNKLKVKAAKVGKSLKDYLKDIANNKKYET